MAKYLYHIRLSRPVTPDSMELVKGELLRLFQSTEPAEVNGHDVKISTPMEPAEAKVILERLSLTHGIAWFTSGTRELQEKE